MARHSAQPSDRRWFRRTVLVSTGAGLIVVTALVVAILLGTTSDPGSAVTSQRNGSADCSAGPRTRCLRTGYQPPTAGAASPASLPPPGLAPTEASPVPPPAAQSQSPAPASPPSSIGAAAAAVLAAINQARTQAGLPAYTVLGGLETSSATHNQLMADGCGLSHQCQGEPSLGDRETAAGVQWTAAGENIGEGGPVPDTIASITQMAVTLTGDMLAEQPPDDGHRLNILSTSFAHVGIAVFRDAQGTVWMTQDFSN